MKTETASSELYLLLENIGDLLACYVASARTPAKLSILAAVADEVDTVSLKLCRMRKRWTLFLPFHEAIDVKFGEWGAEVQGWLNRIELPEGKITSGYLLDLADEPDYELKGDIKRAVPEICGRIDHRLKDSLADWQTRAFPLDGRGTDDELKESLAKAVASLEKLKDELNELEEFFNSELTEPQFKVLALRLFHRDCQDAVKTARNEVNKAHNSWPTKNVLKRAAQKKESVKAEILANEVYKGLADYIDLDYPELFDEATFGQFIFINRHQLGEKDVPAIVQKLETIRLLNTYIDPDGSQKKRYKRAMGRELTPDEVQIVRKLRQLVERVKWRGGATAASINQNLTRLLGVEYALDGEAAEWSDHLWKLLKSRKNCDADRSLMVTWLNIVGWCVNKGYLSGSGSPALCKEFFPKANEDDYKAIDKGRSDPPANFKKVVPLLEKYLR